MDSPIEEFLQLLIIAFTAFLGLFALVVVVGLVAALMGIR